MEVKQVGFDGEGRLAEGGAIAYVGDGVETFFANAGAGDVDAVLRDQFVVAAEVDGGDGVLAAIAAASAGGGEDGEGASEEVAGATDAAGGEKFADAGGGDGFAAESEFVEDLHDEPHLSAEVGEGLDVAGSFVSEVEVVAFVDLAGFERVVEDLCGELSWGEEGEVAAEGEKQDCVNAGGFEKAQFLGRGGEEFEA